MNKAGREKTQSEILRWPEITAKVSLSITLFVSIMGLLGYIPGLRILGAINVAFVPMAPSTAISFILLAVLLIVFRERLNKKLQILFSGISGLISAFGLAKLIEVFISQGDSFEKYIVNISATLGDIPIGIMSPSTGAVFFLSGLSMISLLTSTVNSRFRNIFGNLSGILGSLVLFFGISFLLGYLHEQPFLYGRGSIVPMALTTTLAFIFLGIGSICVSGNKFYPLKYLIGSSAYSKLLRGFLPLALFVGLIVDFVGHYRSVFFIDYNKAIITSLSILIFTIITVVIVFFVSRIVGKDIDREEKKRLKAEKENVSLINNLETKNAEMERFLYTISHDLKSPIMHRKQFYS